MLWSKDDTYVNEPFEKEAHLEAAILEVAQPLFGQERIYLDVKKKIGRKGRSKNIPDGYLLDLTSKKTPKLFVVENELAEHDPLRHIAVQLLQFSLSFEDSWHLVKNIVKEALLADSASWEKCETYATANGFENVDVLLEKAVYADDSFNALVIIDEVPDDLEKVLISRLKFPVDIVPIRRYRDHKGKRLYEFAPFLADAPENEAAPPLPPLDPEELDTIVVPAREDGFEEVFLGEDRWYSVRIHSSRRDKIKYIAAYRVAPESAITHIAPVKSIEQWKETEKFVVNFSESANPIGPIRLVPKSTVKALQASRYTSKTRLDAAKSLDEAF